MFRIITIIVYVIFHITNVLILSVKSSSKLNILYVNIIYFKYYIYNYLYVIRVIIKYYF